MRAGSIGLSTVKAIQDAKQQKAAETTGIRKFIPYLLGKIRNPIAE